MVFQLTNGVLILVLVEYALWEAQKDLFQYDEFSVLILVLVEYAQKSAYNVLNNLKSLVS